MERLMKKRQWFILFMSLLGSLWINEDDSYICTQCKHTGYWQRGKKNTFHLYFPYLKIQIVTVFKWNNSGDME